MKRPEYTSLEYKAMQTPEIFEERFGHAVPFNVQWGEMDAFKHVNNTNYFRYFETARVTYLAHYGVFKLMDEAGIGPILAHTECSFLFPVEYPDRLWAGARIVELADSELRLEQAVFSVTHKRIVAKGGAKVVIYDFQKGRRAEIPQNLHDVFGRLMLE